MTLRVGVIGTGSIANMHLKSYAAHPDVELATLYDLNVERAREKAATFGALHVAESLQELLDDTTIDAVSVCTWNDSHAELAIKVLESGKHVLVEKPLSTTVAEAEKLARAVERSGKRLQVGFVRRFASNAETLKAFIDAGELGEIYHAKATNIRRLGNPGGWFADSTRSGGGPLLDIGVHVLDLCWYLMGSPAATTVSGVTHTRLGNRGNVTSLSRYTVSDYDPEQNDVEDFAGALIRFENGASLLLETSYSLHATNDHLSVAVYGDKGGAELEPHLRIVTEKHNTVLNIEPQIDNSTFNFDEGFAKEISHFVKMCTRDAADIAPVEHGLEMMRILEAVYESSRLGREIDLRRSR